MVQALLLMLAALLVAPEGRPPAVAAPLSVPVCDDVNEWPPYTQFRRRDGERGSEVTGFTVELLREIGRRRGFAPSVHMLPWKRCQAAVQSGEMAGLLNAILTEERGRDFLISPVIYETRLLLLGRSERFPQGLDLERQTELLKLRVGGLHGYSYSQLDAIAPERLERAPNYGSLLHMLRIGRVDVALINEGVLHGLQALNQLPKHWDDGLVIGTLADRQPSRFHMMFSRQHPQGALLREAVTAELAAMHKDGSLARLRAQWLPSRR